MSPLIVLVLIGLPFWFLAQWVVGTFCQGANMCVVASTFTVLLIIPLIIWYAAYSLVCDSFGTFCWLWWIFKAVIEL